MPDLYNIHCAKKSLGIELHAFGPWYDVILRVQGEGGGVNDT